MVMVRIFRWMDSDGSRVRAVGKWIEIAVAGALRVLREMWLVKLGAISLILAVWAIRSYG